MGARTVLLLALLLLSVYIVLPHIIVANASTVTSGYVCGASDYFCAAATAYVPGPSDTAMASGQTLTLQASDICEYCTLGANPSEFEPYYVEIDAVPAALFNTAVCSNDGYGNYALISGWFYSDSESYSYNPSVNSGTVYCYFLGDQDGDYLWFSHGPVDTVPPLSITGASVTPAELSEGESVTASVSWTGDTGPYNVFLDYGPSPSECTASVASEESGVSSEFEILESPSSVTTYSGVYYFCLVVQGALGTEATSQPVAVTVNGNLNINYFILPQAVVAGQPIEMASDITGGVPPYSVEIDQCASQYNCNGDNMLGGVYFDTFDSSPSAFTTSVSAEAMTPGNPSGTEYFQETVVDSEGTVANQMASVQVNGPLSIDSFDLPPSVEAGTYIPVSSSVSGGVPPYTVGITQCAAADCSSGGPIVYQTSAGEGSQISAAILASIPGIEYFRETAIDSARDNASSGIAQVVVTQPAPQPPSSGPPPSPGSGSLSSSVYDDQVGLAFTTNTQSLTYSVPAIAQQDGTGTGPAYLLNGYTNNGYWYQVGLAYNWSLLLGGHLNGFYFLTAVFGPSGASVFHSKVQATVNPGDSVTVSMYIKNGNVIMSLNDPATNAQQTWQYSSFGASNFIGTPADNGEVGTYFTGLMTEWYHNVSYTGDVGFTNTAPVTYRPSSTWPAGPVWQWGEESLGGAVLLFGLDTLEKGGGFTMFQTGDVRSQYNSATGVFTTSQTTYVPPSSSRAMLSLLSPSENSSSESQNLSISALTSNTLESIPILLTNGQPSATPVPFQQMIEFNPSNTTYSANEAADLGNLRFYSGNTPLYSWCESGCNSSSSNAVFWVKLPFSMIADSYAYINMSFESTATEYDGVYAGEAPQLSCNNPANTITGCAAGQYGRYDNGANVFAHYWNFAGTSMPSGWTTGSSKVDNGITGTCTQSAGVIILVPEDMCGGSTYTANTFTPPYVAESYTETLVYNNSVGTGDAAWGLGVITDNNGCVAAYSKPYSNPYIYQFGSRFYLSYAGEISCGYEGMVDGAVGMAVPTPTGAFYTYRLMAESANTFTASVSEGGTPIWSIGESNWQYSASSDLSVGGMNTGDSGRTYWVRTRALPPNGVMPSANLDAAGTVLPLTVPTIHISTTSSEAGKYIGISSIWAGGTPPYSVYIYGSASGGCSFSAQNGWIAYITAQQTGLNASFVPVSGANSTTAITGSYCVSVFDNGSNRYVPVNSAPSAPVTFAPSLTQPGITITPDAVNPGKTASIASSWANGVSPYNVTVKSSMNQTNCSAGTMVYHTSGSANSLKYTVTPPASLYYCIEVGDSRGVNITSNSTPLRLYLPAPTATNTTLDLSQSTVFSTSMTGGAGPFTANFVYCESPIDALVAPGYLCGGTVANTVTGVSASGTAEYAFGPLSSGVYAFNVILTSPVVTFNTTKNTIIVFPTPSASAPVASDPVIGLGQSTLISTSIAGGVGPFTANFVYSNGIVANTVSGLTGIRTAAFNFVPKSAGTYTFNVVISDTGTTTPFAFNTTGISVLVTPTTLSADAPVATNATLDLGQSTTLSSVISGGGGPFTANFVYYEGMALAYRYSNGTTVYVYPDGVVANTVAGIASGGTARYTFKPSSAGIYAFNVVAMNTTPLLTTTSTTTTSTTTVPPGHHSTTSTSTLSTTTTIASGPILFSSTRTSIAVNPTPSATAPAADGTLVYLGQWANLSTTISGGTGPFTADFVYSNGTVANAVTGLYRGGTAAFNFRPDALGAYTFNVVVVDLGTTTPFAFNSTNATLVVGQRLNIVPAVPATFFIETGLPINSTFTVSTEEFTDQTINHTVGINSSLVRFALYEPNSNYSYIIPNVTFNNITYTPSPDAGIGHWLNSTDVVFTALASGMDSTSGAAGPLFNSTVNSTAGATAPTVNSTANTTAGSG